MKVESKSMIALITKFSQEVCHVLKLDNVGGFKKSLIRANPETNMKEFLNELLDIIN